MRVLVAYDSVDGSTAEIAQWIGGELRMAGLDADVRTADAVDSVSGYDGVVLGSTVHKGQWSWRTRSFVPRYAPDLAGTPVWLFSHRSPDSSGGGPVPHAVEAVKRLAARDHVTIDASPEPEHPGFFNSPVARRAYRDYRDREYVRTWAAGIANALTASQRRAG
jgi:menaquinone-dependent protoporphyrinogen oxidase